MEKETHELAQLIQAALGHGLGLGIDLSFPKKFRPKLSLKAIKNFGMAWIGKWPSSAPAYFALLQKGVIIVLIR